MATRCIVCADPAGSGEHIFPACLGGLRVNNGIYCGPHNNGYGDLAAKLGAQLAFFNAHLGIRNSRTKQIKPARLKDPSGAEFDYDGKSLRPVGPRILAQSGNQTSVGFADKAAAESAREQLEAQGVKVESVSEQTFHPDQLGINLEFGGPEGMRAVGYVAQTFLAHCFPDLGCNPAIKPFLDYTLKGTGDNFVWWDFDAPTDLPPNAFDFGHRIIVGADNERGIVYGRVSLFSTLDFAMVFYDRTSPVSSCCVTNDIDPMALKMPDDLKQRRENLAVAPVARPAVQTGSLASAIGNGKAQERHILLMTRAEDHRRRGDAEELLERLNAAGDVAAKQQVVADFWKAEPQRVLRLLNSSFNTIKKQNKRNDPMWHFIVNRLGQATKRDGSALSGLTPGAENAIKVASGALSNAMGEAIRNGTLNQDETEMLIAGGPGAGVAMQAVLSAGIPTD